MIKGCGFTYRAMGKDGLLVTVYNPEGEPIAEFLANSDILHDMSEAAARPFFEEWLNIEAVEALRSLPQRELVNYLNTIMRGKTYTSPKLN